MGGCSWASDIVPLLSESGGGLRRVLLKRAGWSEDRPMEWRDCSAEAVGFLVAERLQRELRMPGFWPG